MHCNVNQAIIIKNTQPEQEENQQLKALTKFLL
jgi:hypothetical protein